MTAVLANTSIGRLLLSGGPSHIPRLIVSVVVDAVNAVFGARATTNMGEKRFKGVSPLSTNSDPSAGIPLEVLARWVVPTSLLDALPRAVLHCRTDSSVGVPAMTVGSESLTGYFCAQAAARSRVIRYQVTSTNDDHVSAFTLTPPERILVRSHRHNFIDNHEAAEASARNISSETGFDTIDDRSALAAAIVMPVSCDDIGASDAHAFIKHTASFYHIGWGNRQAEHIEALGDE